MEGKHTLLILAALLLNSPKTVLAHHSFVAEYDAARIVTLKGVVTKFEWTNPHAHCYLDVKDAAGHVEHWNLELGGPGVLVQNGWSKTTLHEGDVVTVKAALARSSSQKASGRTFTLRGARLFAASPADGGPQ